MATKWVPVSACLIFTSGAVPPNHANQLITIPENQSGTPSNTGMEWNGTAWNMTFTRCSTNHICTLKTSMLKSMIGSARNFPILDPSVICMDFSQLGVSKKTHLGVSKKTHLGVSKKNTTACFSKRTIKKKLGYSEPKQLAFPPQTAQQLTCHKASWRSPERR